MTSLKDLGDRGMSIRIQWVRAHQGMLGNEIADSMAKAARSLSDAYPRRQPIPMYIAASRLHNAAVRSCRESIQLRADDNSTCAVVAYNTRLADNPLLARSKDFSACRRDEVIYNMLTAGCQIATSGFATKQEQWSCPRCPKCGGVDSAKHFLLECPKESQARATLRADVHAAFHEGEDQRIDSARRNGLATLRENASRVCGATPWRTSQKLC